MIQFGFVLSSKQICLIVQLEFGIYAAFTNKNHGKDRHGERSLSAVLFMCFFQIWYIAGCLRVGSVRGFISILVPLGYDDSLWFVIEFETDLLKSPA
jgi:hypothetical protein